MYQFIYSLLEDTGLGSFIHFIAITVCAVAVIVSCLISRLIIKTLSVKILTGLSERKNIMWLDVLLKSKLFSRLSNLMIPLIISIFTYDITGRYLFIDKLVEISFIIVILLALDSCIKSIEVIYSTREISKTFPIHGLLQVVEIVMFIIGSMVTISVFVEKSPTALLGSIGAATAVSSIVFKDAILGFISGIQLTAHDMIRIGDWIELPKHSANGVVVDLTMTTVKVQNFDKTITLIPAYTLVSEEFINWRGMLNTGARRIKRSIFVDVTGVCICDDEMIEKYKRIGLLKNYIEGKITDIEQFNRSINMDLNEKTNGRRMTNIGVFRAYVVEYLRQHPKLNKELPIMVRQLEPGEKGISIEVYAFVNTTEWAEYENTQSDIFDHLYAIITEFDLRLYQHPSSNDLRILDLKQ